MISTNNIEKCYQVLLNVVKNIFCVQEYSIDCNKCTLCHLIDINNLPSLKIIEPIDLMIRKEQITDLKNIFSRKSQYTKESIYIIKEAEKMNKEAANTMLKFLEEPEENIIGFFITNAKDNILTTIQSRCQHIEIIFDNNIYETINITEEEYEKLNEILKNYLYKIEIEKSKLILYNKEYLIDLDKNELIYLFKIMLKIYQNKLENKLKNIITNDYNFLNNYSVNNLEKKVNLIIDSLDKINYNVNIDLFMDNFILEMEDINNETL